MKEKKEEFQSGDLVESLTDAWGPLASNGPFLLVYRHPPGPARPDPGDHNIWNAMDSNGGTIWLLEDDIRIISRAEGEK